MNRGGGRLGEGRLIPSPTYGGKGREPSPNVPQQPPVAIHLEPSEARRLLELARRAGPRTITDVDLLSTLSLLVLAAERKARR